MADPGFDPDAYLADEPESASEAFDPDAYLAEPVTPAPAPQLQAVAPPVPAVPTPPAPAAAPASGKQPSYLSPITVPSELPEQNSSEGKPAYMGPEAKVPFQPFVEGARKFKKSLIDPIVKFHQAKNRELYFGNAFPDEGFGGDSSQPIGLNAPGQMLREASPVLATLAEGVGSLALGETKFNAWHEDKADFLDPRARKVQEQVRTGSELVANAILPVAPKSLAQKREEAIRLMGDVGAAGMQSTLHALSEFGLMLIPGVGQRAVVQGATGGFLSGMVSPDGDPINDAVAGAAIGGALGLGAKGFKKLHELYKARGKSTVPVGVVAPDAVPGFIEHLAAAPEPVIPSKDLSDVAVVIQDVTKAGPTRKAIRITPEGVTAQTLPPAARVPKSVPVEDAKPFDYYNTLTAAEEAALRAEGLAMGLGEHTTLVRREGWLGEPAVGDDWDAAAGTPDLFAKSPQGDGLVLAIEGGDGSGTARLYDIADPKIQTQILETRMLSEVTLPDGRKVLGYPGPGGEILLRPDPDEMIPGATLEDLDLKSMGLELEPISRPRIKEVLRGRDFLLQEAKDAAAVAEADMAAASRDMALGGNGDGSKLPPPPPHDAAGPIPPPNPHNVSPTEEIALNWWERLSRTKLAKGLLAPTSRGPRDVSDLAMSSFSVDTFERLRDDTFKALVKRVPEVQRMAAPEQRQVMTNISRFLTGDIKADQLRSLHPELAASSMRMVEEAKLQTAVDEQRLINLGMLQEGQSVKELLANQEDDIGYLTQMYYRHLLPPGDWKRIAVKDKAGMAALVSAIKNDVYSTGKYKHRTDAQRTALAERHLDFLLGDPEKMAEMKANPESAFKNIMTEAGASLKAKKDLRWWEKAALGEIDNPFVRMAETRARQKQLVLQGELWKAVSENPKLAVHEDAASPQQIKDWVEVPREPNKYGRAAGMLVSPETWEAMVQAPRAQRGISNFVTKSLNAIKFGQTVGNPGSWVTNFISNAQGAVLSNMVNPFASPYAIGKGMLEFSRDLQAHKRAPGVLGDVRRNRFMRMMELGVVGSDYSTAEFRESAALWNKALEQEAGTFNGKVNPLEMFPAMLKKATKTKESLARYYGSIDTMWKYAIGLNGLKKGGVDLDTGLLANKAKALRFIGDRYMPGMSDENILKQVELEMASRIHKSTPMLDRVGSGVAKAGQAAGVVNPYIKVQAEMLRNYATLPKRILTEPGMAANMLGYGTLVGSLYFLNKELRNANGINQEEVDRAFASAPPALARFKPGAMALPWRTAQGRVSLIDLTQLFEPLTYLRGNPETSAGVRILQNMVMAPVSGSLLEPELQNMLATGGYADPAYQNTVPPVWQQSGARLLGEALKRVGPGIIRNTYNTLERGGIGFEAAGRRGPDQLPQSLPVTGANLLLGPNRIQEVGGEAAETRAIQQAAAALKQAERELNNIGPMNEGQSLGSMGGRLDKDEAFLKARAVVEERKAALQKLQSKFPRR